MANMQEKKFSAMQCTPKGSGCMAACLPKQGRGGTLSSQAELFCFSEKAHGSLEQGTYYGNEDADWMLKSSFLNLIALPSRVKPWQHGCTCLNTRTNFDVLKDPNKPEKGRYVCLKKIFERLFSGDVYSKPIPLLSSRPRLNPFVHVAIVQLRTRRFTYQRSEDTASDWAFERFIELLSIRHIQRCSPVIY